MRELTRSNDAVFLSWISASLSEAGISAVTLDGFSSGLLQPLNVTAGQRIMVADEDYWNAWAVLADAEGLISEDEILGARVSILQPKSGFRAAIDPVLLAASVPAEAGERVLELGSGTGAAALALAARTKARLIDGVDLQPDLVALANRSALLNGVSDRVRFHVGDILVLPAPAVPYDHVMANPPYLAPDAAQPPKDPARATAMIEGDAGLADWVEAGLRSLRPGGTLSFVHRADRVDEILTALANRAGGVGIIEFLTKGDGRPAKRAIVQATKGAGGGDSVRKTMLLHGDNGDFTAEADAVLRDAGALAISS